MMIKPKFSVEANENGNWNVIMTRSTKSGVVLQTNVVAMELDESEAEELASDMQKGSDAVARALCNFPENRAEDYIYLTFSF